MAAVLSDQRSAAQMARRFKVSEAAVSHILAARRTAAASTATGAPPGVEPAGTRIACVLPMAALDERLAVVRTSGSGKNYACKGLVERLLEDSAGVCIVDPLGVWWGLRAGPDGVSPARHSMVVFGGRQADVPLAAGRGAPPRRLVGSQALACVVDVSDFGSAATRRHFMMAFTAAFYDSNAGHLVLNEAAL